jgi:PAS domain S-box-containing protein
MSKKDYILYVDDNETNLQLFYEYLSDIYEIILETSPIKAFDLLKKFPFKIIVSDQRMPEEEGLDFLKRVHQFYPDIIKILCTAYVDEESAIRAINQGGIFRYIPKPYSYEYLQEVIQYGIQEYNLRSENQKLIKELQLNNTILQQAFNQIKEQQIKLYNIYNQSSDGIIVIKDQEVIEANPAFLKILDLNIDERILPTCSEIIQKKYPQLLQLLLNNAPERKIFEMEIFLSTSEKRNIEVHPTFIDYLGSQAILSVIRDITERKQQEQKVLEAVFSTQENDQRRYSKELHDGIGPLLSTLKMYIEWITNPEAKNKEEISAYAINTIDEAIRQLKSIANQMSPHLLERFGLIQCLTDFLEQLKNSFSINYSFSSNFYDRLSDQIETGLYRILMEAINNTLKYANASNISIEIKKENEQLFVSYKDNGKGFDLERTISEGNGMGLFNINNRIQLLKGVCNMNSIPGKGFEMNLIIPINK